MNWYHRKLQDNERVIRIELEDNKAAFLLFTRINNQWICLMEEETMTDLKTAIGTKNA